jgi:hypothetical protein
MWAKGSRRAAPNGACRLAAQRVCEHAAPYGAGSTPLHPFAIVVGEHLGSLQLR